MDVESNVHGMHIGIEKILGKFFGRVADADRG
jgi:hypothetical protein